MQNPRCDFIRAIQNNDLARCLVKTAEIHGHFCPGSALGVMASVYGLNQLGMGSIPSDGMENLMAIVEINACFADGVQAVSGCTLGNNGLVYRDLGRHAVTFAIRERGTGVRVRVLPRFRAHVARAAPEFFPLVEMVIKDRSGDEGDLAALRRMGKKAAFALIQLPFEDLFAIETVRPDLPDYAPITESAVCPGCKESIMATKVMAEGAGRGLCFSCAGRGYRQVDGRGIVAKEPKAQLSSIEGVSDVSLGKSATMTNEDQCNCRVHGQKGLRRGRSSFWMHDPELAFAELALKDGDCFLDMGCGPGDYAIRASGIVGESGAVYALDRWQDVIDDLAAKAASRGLGNLKAIVSDITDPLPIKDECVDVCLISTVLHSLDLVDVGEILFGEIRRVLRHGGRLVIIECKKEEQNFGPPIDIRLSPEQLEVPIARYGFIKVGLADLGYNYMIKFIKN